MTYAPLERIAQLRRIVEALDRGESLAVADGQWMAAALQGYLADAAMGVSLEAAMGLTAPPGQSTWWRLEALAKRNAAIVDLYRHLFADMGFSKASTEIARVVHRVRNPPRKTAHAPIAKEGGPVDPHTDRLIAAALYSGAPFPAPKQIANILEIKTPI